MTKRLTLFVLLLLLTGLACQAPVRLAATETPSPIPVTTEAAGELESRLATAAAELETTGQVTVTFTENQITSYIVQQLAATQETRLSDPQVTLQDGLIEVTGKVSVSLIKANARIVLEPYVDQGDLRMAIREAKFGSIPIPDATLEELTATLNQNLSEFTSINGRKFRLEVITITDGTMTLSGKLD